jgi:hypothetical protein
MCEVGAREKGGAQKASLTAEPQNTFLALENFLIELAGKNWVPGG